MRYIDAERLRAEIDKLKGTNLVNRDKFKFADMAVSFYYEGRLEMCDKILSLITSLQQEQPPLPSNLALAAQIDALRAYAMPEEGNIDEVFKVQETRFFHEIGFKAGAEWMAKQKQPEVELEEEIDQD